MKLIYVLLCDVSFVLQISRYPRRRQQQQRRQTEKKKKDKPRKRRSEDGREQIGGRNFKPREEQPSWPWLRLVVLFFVLCRWRWRSPPARGRRGRSVAPFPRLLFITVARGQTRHQWRWRVGRRATVPPMCPELLRGPFLYFSLCLCLYLNFYCIFNYCWKNVMKNENVCVCGLYFNYKNVIKKK